MLSITRLKVLRDDLSAIEGQLGSLALQMPQAVRGMAVILDSDVPLSLAPLVGHLRGLGMELVGVAEGPIENEARAMGLAVVSKDAGRPTADARRPSEPSPEPAPAKTVTVAVGKPAKIVNEPVRSGQQIYADGCDLIVLNTISPGAEVIADGCIHIYGALRGRAIAGARGDESARVFCRKMEAELIAIAGIYAVSEQINAGPRGQAAQAWLDLGQLKIEAHKV